MKKLSPHDWQQQIKLRQYTSDDNPFLEQLYASVREPELAVTNFTNQEKQQFIQQQFSAQMSAYLTNYAQDNFFIIEVNGNKVGRLFVDHWASETRIVDITLIPEFRNLGLGSHLFNQLFIQAQQSQLPITIHVERNNPALKLYQRLGFTVKEQNNDVYILMVWSPNKAD